MIKKILCAVDDTEYSKAAIAVTAELAKATDAKVTFLAVNQLLGGYGHGGVSTYIWDSATMKRVLSDATVAAKKAGVKESNTVDVKSRDIGRAIVVFAEENDIDHVVVGTGGKSAISRLMLGSISSDVLARAHCPVTVARLHK
ncbi:MAG: universal stress protein [Gammaproteobacteria bacterium]|nr:universal stress protein [Gammaproteobacteria bacterium]